MSLPELTGSLADLDMRVAIRRPGYKTVRRTLRNWGEVNALVVALAAGMDYPQGAVLTVSDWTGIDRFLLRGGAAAPATLIKLTDKVHGLPENPAKAAPDPPGLSTRTAD